jgi:excisionase family DNA binding protein
MTTSVTNEPHTGNSSTDALPRLRAETTPVAPVDRLLTPSEVAALFGVDPRTVTRWAAAGNLNPIRTPGGHRRYRRSEVLALRATLARAHD